jgi:hypothetical protein
MIVEKNTQKNRKFSEEIITSPDIQIEDGFKLMDLFIYKDV